MHSIYTSEAMAYKIKIQTYYTVRIWTNEAITTIMGGVMPYKAWPQPMCCQILQPRSNLTIYTHSSNEGEMPHYNPQ